MIVIVGGKHSGCKGCCVISVGAVVVARTNISTHWLCILWQDWVSLFFNGITYGACALWMKIRTPLILLWGHITTLSTIISILKDWDFLCGDVGGVVGDDGGFAVGGCLLILPPLLMTHSQYPWTNIRHIHLNLNSLLLLLSSLRSHLIRLKHFEVKYLFRLLKSVVSDCWGSCDDGDT